LIAKIIFNSNKGATAWISFAMRGFPGAAKMG
jgi:hypothetical protein